MPKPLVIDIGNIPISLNPDKAEGQFEFVKKTGLFISQTSPEVALQIHCGIFPELSQGEVCFETNIGWQLSRVDGRMMIKIPTIRDHQMGIFSPDYRSGEIYVGTSYLDPNLYIFPLAYPMGELLLLNLLGAGLGVMMHAAGVIYRGEGYLFTGRGGAGKSTTARLWHQLPGAQVINDDKVIVRKEDGQFIMYGTPWHGEGGMALPLSAPLKHFYVLKQADHNYAVPLPPLKSILLLLERTFMPLWDQEKMDFTMRFFDELLQQVPCQELGFLPQPSAVEFVINQ